MKEKRPSLWQWCPAPERVSVVNRSRRIDRGWVPLMASALILTLLAIQGVQVSTPSTANVFNPNSYGAVLPAAQSPFQSSSLASQASEASQASQTIVSVSTDHFTVQFTFPESVDPGNAITVSAITTAKSDGRAASLTIDVFSYVGGQLVNSASETILTDTDVESGDNWQTSISVAIPTNAQRGPLIGTVAEVWEEEFYYSTNYYYPDDYSEYCWDYAPYHYPKCDTRQTAPQTTDTTQTYPVSQVYPPISTPENYTTSLQNYLSQPQRVRQPPYTYQPRCTYEPSYVCEPTPYYRPRYGLYYYAPTYTTQTSSEQVFPLTYILATTPEYLEVQKMNDQLQKDNNDLIAKNNDLSSKYNSLKADYDRTVVEYSQLQSDYNSTSQELGNFRIFTYALIVLAAALVVALALVAMYRRRPVVSSAAQPPGSQ